MEGRYLDADIANKRIEELKAHYSLLMQEQVKQERLNNVRN